MRQYKTLLNGFGLLFAGLMLFYVLDTVFDSARQKAQIRHIDGRTIYISGVCWLSGQSPYNVETFTRVWNQNMHQEQFQPKIPAGQVVFLYPPSLGIIAIPLALFSWQEAKVLLDVINVLALILVALFSALLLRKLSIHWSQIGLGLGLSVWGQLSYILAVIVLSQTALWVTAATLAAFYWAWRQQYGLVALSIVLASIKPQLSLLPIIYLLIISQSGLLWLLAIVLVTGTQLTLFMVGADSHIILELLRSLALYQAHSANTPLLLPGLHTLLAHFNVHPQVIEALPILGITITIVLALFYLKEHHRYSDYQKLLFIALTLTLSAVFMPIHHYDYTLFFFVMMLIVVVKPLSSGLLLLPGLIVLALPHLPSHFVREVFNTPLPTLITASIAALYLMIALAGSVIMVQKRS